MLKQNQEGAVNGLILALVFTSLLLIAAIAFGVWAYNGRQDYKNNVNGKIDNAVSNAIQQEDQLKNNQFAQKEQEPLITYNGPQAYGSLVVMYPRNWSGYVDTTGTDNTAVDGFFNPGVVPSVNDATSGNSASVFALTVQVLNQSYAQTIQSFQGQSGITVNAYALPKLPKIVGVEVSGSIGNNQTNETMVVLPLRSETLEIATDGNQYLSQFNSIILPNFSFSP